MPKMEKEKLARNQAIEQSAKAPQPIGRPSAVPGAGRDQTIPRPDVKALPSNLPKSPAAAGSRTSALGDVPRVQLLTPSLRGSIALKGARLDDLVLRKYRETTKKNSPEVTYLSPSGSPNPYYAEYGWVSGGGGEKLPDGETVWSVASGSTLAPGAPVTLRYDNGAGLIFRRTISIDENYMFTVRQEVENKTGKPVTLFPYALISRHGKPQVEGFFILHEGMIGMLGEEGLQEIGYDDALEDKVSSFKAVSGWLGITDKYWATAIIPPQTSEYQARISGSKSGNVERFQTDYLLGAVNVPAGGVASVTGHLFAGAKVGSLIDDYGEKLKIKKFDLMIDWGWFYFITKPLFWLIDWCYKFSGNFGIAILLVTVFVKLAFFPLANKSYISMSKMKLLQPQMTKIRERYGDDKVKQQQAIMKLYKEEKVNPMSGCLPILLQIPVFFALYKVLFVTIEMRHAPFFGWIQDLSAKDPTTVFNLFGLLPFSTPDFLTIGIWPLIMGFTMWIQMQLNPSQPDPIQQKIFAWMPVFFTFILAPFPAGLVIYWAWNNTLSIIQQWVIMSRQGVEVKLLENSGLSKLWNKSSSS